MRYRTVCLLLAAAVFGACASKRADTIVAAVDERTGESFTRLDEPLRLATGRPGLSVVGRDYLLVAPVMLTGSAEGGRYLWFALGTTLDRPLHGAPEPGLDRIVLVVDDMPMTLRRPDAHKPQFRLARNRQPDLEDCQCKNPERLRHQRRAPLAAL